jgi:hypothetical protein
LTALLEWGLASVRAHSVDAIDPRPIAAGVI